MTLERLTPWFLVAVAVAALSTALTAQIMFDKEPCILCLFQRVPYVVTALLALLTLKLPTGSSVIPLIIVLCALTYLTGSGIAIYHVGVEQHWWISACTGSTADLSFEN